MPGQYGLAADSHGVRTAPETLQQVIAAEYGNAADCPVVLGGQVTGRADMRYEYTAGVGLIKTAAGAYFVTWDAGQTGIVDSVTSGTATDTLYVDRDGLVNVTREQAPANVCVLDRRSVPAGATATSDTSSIHTRKWALSRGQGEVKLAEHVDPSTSGEAHSPRFLWATLAFSIAYAYDLRVVIDQALTTRGSAGLAPGNNALEAGSCRYTVELDGAEIDSREIMYTRVWELKQTTIYVPNVRAGSHMLRIYRQHQWGSEAEHHDCGRSRATIYRDSMVA